MNPRGIRLRCLLSIAALLTVVACGGAADPALVVDPGVVGVTVAPSSAQLQPSTPQPFAATVTGTMNTAVTWQVTETSTGGTIDAAGLYQAPSSPGTYHVVATSVADGTKSATATVTVTTPPPPPISLAAQLDVLSRRALFFDHASVGGNLMDGVAGLLATVSSAKPALINMNVSSGGLRPDLIHTGIWAESAKLALLNERPMEKVAMFKTDLGSGVGAAVDIAFMKFCFVDFTNATDVDALFAAYQSMITSVKALYPRIHFVHVTAPLESPSNGAFNAKREAFSAKVRAAYGTDVFDLALLESTRPDGTRETVGGVPALVPAYTSDSGHLNATGQARVVPEFVKFLANLP